MFPLVLALELWGSLLQNKCIVSNQKMKPSKDKHLMKLVRRFVVKTLQHNVLCRAEHIPGSHNILADFLSRDQVHTFLRSRRPTTLRASQPRFDNVFDKNIQQSSGFLQELPGITHSRSATNISLISTGYLGVHCTLLHQQVGCIYDLNVTTINVVRQTNLTYHLAVVGTPGAFPQLVQWLPFGSFLSYVDPTQVPSSPFLTDRKGEEHYSPSICELRLYIVDVILHSTKATILNYETVEIDINGTPLPVCVQVLETSDKDCGSILLRLDKDFAIGYLGGVTVRHGSERFTGTMRVVDIPFTYKRTGVPGNLYGNIIGRLAFLLRIIADADTVTPVILMEIVMILRRSFKFIRNSEHHVATISYTYNTDKATSSLKVVMFEREI
ncbi:hypothetical protein MAR_027821 [Mya arenaria]|uniref:Uncharacterized protein n=1 Tax=Mya arenaria TaxID=6604 RepID=A0ABY7EY92_MYAAR|nr:hypothetical protein MAR_027821 [Mya arenaria]